MTVTGKRTHSHSAATTHSSPKSTLTLARRISTWRYPTLHGLCTNSVRPCTWEARKRCKGCARGSQMKLKKKNNTTRLKQSHNLTLNSNCNCLTKSVLEHFLETKWQIDKLTKCYCYWNMTMLQLMPKIVQLLCQLRAGDCTEPFCPATQGRVGHAIELLSLQLSKWPLRAKQHQHPPSLDFVPCTWALWVCIAMESIMVHPLVGTSSKGTPLGDEVEASQFHLTPAHGFPMGVDFPWICPLCCST